MAKGRNQHKQISTQNYYFLKSTNYGNIPNIYSPSFRAGGAQYVDRELLVICVACFVCLEVDSSRAFIQVMDAWAFLSQ